MSNAWDNFTNWLSHDPADKPPSRDASSQFWNWLVNSPLAPSIGQNKSLSQMFQPAPPAGTKTKTDPGTSQDNLASLYESLFGKGAQSAQQGSAPAGYYTPDGVWINDGS